VAKTVPVNVQDDHLQKIASVSRPIDAVAELVWNALDADATEVRVVIARNNMTGLESIRVIDNGRGMDYTLAEQTFGHLGGSWKKTQLRTPSGRALHGKDGRGRFKAFALGTFVEWNTRFHDPESNEAIAYTLTGDWNHLREFNLSDFTVSRVPTTGTDVEIRNFGKDFPSLEDNRALQSITEQFALYLRQYPQVRIIYNGAAVDPNLMRERETDYRLPRIRVGDQVYPADLTIIEWKNDQERAIFLCDGSGFTLHEVKPQIHAAGFHFTAYVKSDYIRFLADRNMLATEDVHPVLYRLLDAARERLRGHFRARQAEESATLVEEWKREGVYPYEEPPGNTVEEAGRQVFDIVAATVHRYVPRFEDTEREGKRLTFALLREAVETSPDAVRRIFGRLLQLPKEKQEELAELLDRVSLESMIGALKLVKDRIDFVRALELLVFDPESKQQLAERKQLHRILATQTWVFGEQFSLTVDDKGLTKVLEAHLALLGRASKKITPVREEDGSVGIVDLMLSRAIPQQTNRREHLVIELKAPKVKITEDETNQIEKYAHAVASDEQFRDTDTEWTFILVGNEYNDLVNSKITQRNRPKGMLIDPAGQDRVKYTVWVKTWAQIVADCKWRMKFFSDHLAYVSEDDDAIAHLRKAHDKFLPKVFAKEVAADPHVAEQPDIVIATDDELVAPDATETNVADSSSAPDAGREVG
jgi:hypothetical protein